MSARSMMIVFAFGMSSPDSMIVVQTRTSASPDANASITFSSSPFGHLAVADDEARAGQHLAQLVGLRLDRLDAVVDVEHLPAAVQLAQDRVADQAGRRLCDARLDRQAILRRRLDDRQVAHAREGQVQRPRDRRGRQRQHVDLVAELLQALLRGDAEALLLVHDHEAEIAELDVLREQPVRADHEVDRPVREAGERRPPAPSA